jgi:hypothetical protein
VKRQPGSLLVLMILVLLMPALGSPIQVSRIRKVGKAPNFIALSPDGRNST